MCTGRGRSEAKIENALPINSGTSSGAIAVAAMAVSGAVVSVKRGTSCRQPQPLPSV